MVLAKIKPKGSHKDLEPVLSFLSEENNFEVLEGLLNNYIISNSEYSISKFLLFQFQLNSIFDDKSVKIFKLLRTRIKLNYHGEHLKVLERFLILKKISQFHLNQIQKAIDNPNGLSACLVLDENTRLLIAKNDTSIFNVNLGLDSGAFLVNQVLELLTNQLKDTDDELDEEMYSTLIINYEKLIKAYKEREELVNPNEMEEQI